MLKLSVTSACIGDSLVVICDRYEWTRDGNVFSSSDKITIEDGSGTITIKDPNDADAGLYQCSARNGGGKAISNTTLLVKSVRAQFTESATETLRATIGKPLTLDCRPLQQNIPTSTADDFSWRLHNDERHWQLGRRVQIDDSGKCYVCTVSPFLSLLFNKSLTSGCFPTQFKRAVVCPLLKKEGLDASQLKNYRPLYGGSC